MTARLVRLAALGICFALATSTASRATDIGPGRGVREVRLAVPILLQARMHELRDGESTSVDDAIVARDNAIVDWRTKSVRGISVLTYRNARWWMTGTVFEWPQRGGWSWWMSDTSTAEYGCPGGSQSTTAPDAAFLSSVLHADAMAVALWTKTIAPIDRASPADGSAHAPSVTRTCPTDRPTDVLWFESTNQIGTVRSTTAGYGRIDLLNIDGYRPDWYGSTGWSQGLTHGISRAPTDAEMSSPGADAVFFFSATVGQGPVAIPKTRLDVWCPFVLDPGARYSLAITGGETIVGPLDGTMTNNILHFDLSAFAAKPGTYLQGEIDVLRKLPGT